MTDLLKDGDNFLAIEVNNRRTKDAIPAMAFDWWNYGGITRDVLLVKTPRTFIEDYFIQLDKNAPDRIIARVRLWYGGCSLLPPGSCHRLSTGLSLPLGKE